MRPLNSLNSSKMFNFFVNTDPITTIRRKPLKQKSSLARLPAIAMPEKGQDFFKRFVLRFGDFLISEYPEYC